MLDGEEQPSWTLTRLVSLLMSGTITQFLGRHGNGKFRTTVAFIQEVSDSSLIQDRYRSYLPPALNIYPLGKRKPLKNVERTFCCFFFRAMNRFPPRSLGLGQGGLGERVLEAVGDCRNL